MARKLADGQLCRVHTYNIATGEDRIVFHADDILYEAPNWTHDGASLIVNGDGHLFEMSLTGDPTPRRIDFGELPELNNDHVLAPDGKHVYVSADNGHIYRGALAGGVPVRVTPDDGNLHYLHGVSPDGGEIAYIGIALPERAANGRVEFGPGSVWTLAVDVAGVDAAGPDGDGVSVGRATPRLLTDDPHHDDGSEYSPDGTWIYFNSERGSDIPGHAQLFRMRRDGSGIEQLTHDERVNWFPHVAPNGSVMAYISFPPGTLGHPADRSVILRLANPDGTEIRDLVALEGGQGTINVPSWSPDSTHIAYVDYPQAQK